MPRLATVVALVLALTAALGATSGPASAEPNPVETAVALITGPGHCC